MSRISKQPDVRKQELLDIGVKLYFAYGEKGITVQRIVREADVATGLFYYYFKSKDHFLDEAMNGYIEHQFAVFTVLFQKDDIPVKEQLNDVLRAYFDYVKAMLPYRKDLVFHSERHFALTHKLLQRMQEPIYAFIEKGVQEGFFQVAQTRLASHFIVSGLASIFDVQDEINDAMFLALKTYVYRILEVK